jgi:uroporphyrinogen decarboxylase
VIATVEAIRDPMSTRQILAHYHAAEIDLDGIELPDYANRQTPLVEVFTLDSSTCAACGYMLLAAQRATTELGDRVEMVEYKATKPENIARMQKLGVKNLPCILINGKLRFSSLIPSQKELISAIEEA